MMQHQGLIKLENVNRLLAEVRTLDDAKALMDKAAAAQVWARRAKLGLQAQNQAAEIKIRAERKAGELLGGLEKGKTGPKKLDPSPGSNSAYREAVKAAGAERHEAARWQQVAKIPEEKFEKVIAVTKGAGRELSTGDLLKGEIKETRRQERFERAEALAGPTLTTARKFCVIYADPPWRFNHRLSDSRRIENQYPTMELGDICTMPVGEIAAKTAALFLWAVPGALIEAHQVMKAWGFDYRAQAVWVKPSIGMGWYWRNQHELLLLGTRGDFPTPSESARVSSVIHAPVGKHSAKPVEFRQMIEGMYPKLSRIELFARGKIEGWDTWGNQAA